MIYYNQLHKPKDVDFSSRMSISFTFEITKGFSIQTGIFNSINLLIKSK